MPQFGRCKVRLLGRYSENVQKMLDDSADWLESARLYINSKQVSVMLIRERKNNRY